ncbi:MAG: TonB-dependent receptor [Candidatus Acidiferrum sp.]
MSANERTTLSRAHRAAITGSALFLALLFTCEPSQGQVSTGAQIPQGQAAEQSQTQSPAQSSTQDASQEQQGSQEPPAAQKDLTQVSIEDLMNMDVTSVSKKDEKLSRTAAAIFVITSEDIRRSGATNIPDLLRMVPGMEVAQINANTWAVSARGFNGEFSNELLVLVDGRNVYLPTFGGVFWDVLDFPLEDIDRIEVIRGPGGSIWGANSAGGVINIITKKAGETQGAMVVAGGGNLNQGFETTQYGGKVGDTDFRVFTKYFNQDHMPSLTGQNGGDGWHNLRGGFRTDTTLGANDSLMFQGDIYTGNEGNPTMIFPSVTSPGEINVDPQVDLSGGFLQSVWDHTLSAHSSTELTVSYNAYQRNDALREGRKTFDIDFQHHIAWGSRQDFVWGAGYRDSESRSDGNLTVSLNPAHVDSQYFSSFVQDEIALVPDRFFLTLGTKLEHDYYTGFALLPSARATYALRPHQMLWAAVSRAVRTPAATDTSIRLNVAGFPGPNGVPAVVAVIGNPLYKNEDVLAYEFGYRTTLGKRLSMDFAAYYNQYNNQQTTEPAAPFFEPVPAPAHLVLPSTYQNLMHGEGHGLEATANWKVTDHWTISPGYDLARLFMQTSPLSQDPQAAAETDEGDPHVQAQIRSHAELTAKLDWDTSVYFVDRILITPVPAYTRLDSGLTWRLRERVSLSLVGQNLLRDSHLEFVDSAGASRSTLIKRSAYAKITWQL